MLTFLGGFVAGVLISVLVSRAMCRSCARKYYAKHGPTSDEEVLEKLYKEKAEKESRRN
jgi:hypothetical protein